MLLFGLTVFTHVANLQLLELAKYKKHVASCVIICDWTKLGLGLALGLGLVVGS